MTISVFRKRCHYLADTSTLLDLSKRVFEIFHLACLGYVRLSHVCGNIAMRTKEHICGRTLDPLDGIRLKTHGA